MTPDGAPSVWVAHDEDDPRARAIIEEHRKAPMPEGHPWRCRICEEENDGGFSNCWKCAGGPSSIPNREKTEGPSRLVVPTESLAGVAERPKANEPTSP